MQRHIRLSFHRPLAGQDLTRLRACFVAAPVSVALLLLEIDAVVVVVVIVVVLAVVPSSAHRRRRPPEAPCSAWTVGHLDRKPTQTLGVASVVVVAVVVEWAFRP